MKPTILYLSYDGLTDPLGQSQVLPYITGLSEKGYRFTIISFEKMEKFEKLKNEIKGICREHSIMWIPLRYHKNPPIIFTLFDIWKLWRTVKKEYRANIFQIVHCRSYITSLVGLKAKQKWGVKLIFDMRGFWVDERVEGGIWKLSNPIFRLIYCYFKRKEKHFISMADHIVTLTHTSKLIIKDRFKVEEAVISVIPCCVDIDFFNPDKIDNGHVNVLKKMLHIEPDCFVLLYLGSLGTWYMLDEMLVFFKYLMKIKPSAKFLFVTPDSSEKIIKSACAHNIEPESLIIRSTDRESIPIYISLANISVLFIKPSFSKQASSPTKLGEVLSMGIPVVVNAGIGDIDFLFREDGCGVLVKSFQKKVMEEAAQQVDVLLQLDRCAVRSVAKRNFSLEDGVQKYAMIYSSLLY